MNKNTILLIVGAVVILGLILIVSLGPRTEEILEEPEVVVHYLAVNGLTDPQVFLNLGDESIISATIENPGSEEISVIMSVRKDGDLFDHRHDWTYVLQPGEIKEVEEVREVHHTWYPGVFTVEVGDKVIEKIVQEED